MKTFDTYILYEFFYSDPEKVKSREQIDKTHGGHTDPEKKHNFLYHYFLTRNWRNENCSWRLNTSAL